MVVRRRIVPLGLVLALVTAFVLVMSDSASADPPVPSQHGNLTTLHCDQLGTLQVISNGNGRWDLTAQPMHVLNSNLVLVAYSFRVELTPPGGQTQVLVDHSKPPPQDSRLDICHATETDPVLGTASITWGVSYTGGP
jgi:hypothetical protein